MLVVESTWYVNNVIFNNTVVPNWIHLLGKIVQEKYYLRGAENYWGTLESYIIFFLVTWI